MSRILTLAVFGLAVSGALAQDLVITDARIIDGAGGIIEQGYIVIRDGQISSVSEGATDPGAAARINAAGMTVMPGLIDTHRHVIGAVDSEQSLEAWLDEQAPAAMYAYLVGGFTTILSPGDNTSGILELRRRLQAGEITGPRLLVSGGVFRAPNDRGCQNEFCLANANFISGAEQAREKVRAAAAAGVDVVKATLDAGGPLGPVPTIDADTLAAVADEARAQGVVPIAHAITVEDMMTAIEAGASRLVHTPLLGSVVGTEAGRVAREAGVAISTTIGWPLPEFDENNEPHHHVLGGYPPYMVTMVGQVASNGRHLWNEGVILAFGTDTDLEPAAALTHEVRALSPLFSPEDVVTMLTRNAAVYLNLADEIGTLEPGKLADIVIVDGDPLSDISALGNLAVVIKSGEVVVDNR